MHIDGLIFGHQVTVGQFVMADSYSIDHRIVRFLFFNFMGHLYLYRSFYLKLK